MSATMGEVEDKAVDAAHAWPAEGLTRVPYWVYQDSGIYVREQSRIFRGPTWNFLCLESELRGPGDFKTSFVGEMPVVVTRDEHGELAAFENRCAHRGALLCLKERGNAKEIACVYHNWTYDLKGNLTAVAFRRGVRGKGGMPADARPEAHAPRKLRVASFAGLVFGTLSAEAPPITDYLGPKIDARIRRVMKAPSRVLGVYSQMLHNNWKLYAENVRDTYHASLLHLFYTTFRISRLTQEGGVFLDSSGGNHVVEVHADPGTRDLEYERAGLRAATSDFRLADPSVIAGRDEFGDGIAIRILTVFPGFVMQQVQNSLAVRQIIPRGVEETELVWTYFGFADDDEATLRARIKQSNLVGPAGYVSMDDGAAVNFVQRGIAAAAEESSVVEMGGAAVASSRNTRATETSVRGFWQAYRRLMDL